MNAVLKMEARAMGVRVPPHSIEAEQAVLGMLMIAPDKLDTLADKLSEGDFYRNDHKAIWRAITELSARGQPCDAVTLGDWFDNNNLAHMVGGGSYMIELANATASAANIAAYAQIIREKSVRRQVIDSASQLMEDAYAPDTGAVELVDRGIADLMGLQKVEARNEFTLRQAMTEAYQHAQEARERGNDIPGIPTGLSMLNRVLGGWHDSDLVVIGARPAMGKTALLLNMAIAAKVPCGIISAEQPAVQVGARVMSIKSNVPAELMRNGRFETQDLKRLEYAIGELCDRTCMIYDRSGPSIADVRRMARKWVQQNHIRILFVDYIQRIKSVETRKSANKAERVGEVAQALKDLARDLNIPVVALAQVKREAANRMPRMDDLSDSSEIEKEADQIIMLDRPEEYDENAEKGTAVLGVDKNRHGRTGDLTVTWLPETMRFVDYASHD